MLLSENPVSKSYNATVYASLLIQLINCCYRHRNLLLSVTLLVTYYYSLSLWTITIFSLVNVLYILHIQFKVLKWYIQAHLVKLPLGG
jgi:hypothetical protein